MKKWLSLLLAGSLAVPAGVSAQASSDEQKLLVVFEEKVDKRVIAKAEGEIDRTYQKLPVAAVTVPADEINELKNDPRVKRVEKDIVVRASAQTMDWGIEATNTPAAWNAGYTGKGIKVAVVDTGVAPHTDLQVAGGASFVDYTTSYEDDNGHGTIVAGIIGAEDNSFGTKGAAPDADVYAVKSLGKDGSGNLSSIIAGIDWAIVNKMDIVNLSLGTQTHSSVLQSVVDKAYANGILVVAAAGNDGTAAGTEDTVDYPARYSSAIAVGAVDSTLRRADFSSTGSTVEVAAPGVGILATYLNNGYAKANGTSMAAPYIAGELALLKQANPGASNISLRQKLIESSKDLGTAGRDSFYGFGFSQVPASNMSVTQTTAAQSPVTSLAASVQRITGMMGETKKVTVASTHQDGKVVDRTAEAVWKSENTKIAAVTGGSVTLKGFGKTNITASYGGKTVKIPVDTTIRQLTASTTNVSGKPGKTSSIQLIATLADGQKAEVTSAANWKTSNSRVATAANGTISIKQYGKTYAAASYGGKFVSILVQGK